jgi:hypothetical protein
MHVRLKKKTAKKRKQMREQTRRNQVKKILEDAIIKTPATPPTVYKTLAASDDPKGPASDSKIAKGGSNLAKVGSNLAKGGSNLGHDDDRDDLGSNDVRPPRSCSRCGSRAHLLDPSRRRMRYSPDEIAEILKFPSKIAPREGFEETRDAARDFEIAFASRAGKTDGASFPSSLSTSERFEKGKEVEDFVKKLFYSDFRTQIYEASAMVPRDKGERAVKGEWTAAIKAHKRRQDLEKRRTKIETEKADIDNGVAPGDRSSKRTGRASGKSGSTGCPNQETPDYVVSGDSPGFTTISGFITYVNVARKNMRIKKTPRLPYDKRFVGYFSQIVLTHWDVLKTHRLGRPYVKDKKTKSSGAPRFRKNRPETSSASKGLRGGFSSIAESKRLSRTDRSIAGSGKSRDKTSRPEDRLDVEPDEYDEDYCDEFDEDADALAERDRDVGVTYRPEIGRRDRSEISEDGVETSESEGNGVTEKCDDKADVLSSEARPPPRLLLSSSNKRNDGTLSKVRDGKSKIDVDRGDLSKNDDDDDHDEEEENDDQSSKKSKKPLGALCFSGLCIALLYMMRMGAKTKGGRDFVWKCKYVADEVPQMKDLEAYDRRYTCKLINGCTAIIKTVYDRMETERALPETELKHMEDMTEFYGFSSFSRARR